MADTADTPLKSSTGAMWNQDPKAACVEVLLRDLGQLTCKDTFPGRALPPDFCLQLQFMEFVAQQSRLLHQVYERVEQVHSCLNDQFGLQLGALQKELRDQVSNSIREAFAVPEMPQQAMAKPVATLSSSAEAACQLSLLRKELREELGGSILASVEAALAKGRYVQAAPGIAPDMAAGIAVENDTSRAMVELNQRMDQMVKDRLVDLSPIRDDIKGILSNTLEGQNLMQRLEDRLSQKMVQVLDALQTAPGSTSTDHPPPAPKSPFKAQGTLQATPALTRGRSTDIITKVTSAPLDVITESPAGGASCNTNTQERVPLKNAEEATGLGQGASTRVVKSSDASMYGAQSLEPEGSPSGASSRRWLPQARTRENLAVGVQTWMESTLGHEANKEWWLHRAISHPAFDGFCTLVILVNAFTIGINTQLGIEWAISHPGEGDPPKNSVIVMMDRVFIGFYLLELLLKLSVFRSDFFFEKDAWKWNTFDFVLVLFGIYDFLSEFVDVTGGLSITWLRMMRLLKTMKMLRVVRVMRFFKVLRTMLSNVVASMATLFWSVLMLVIIMYMFGLVFIQAVTSYLSITPKEEVHVEDIENYWSGVGQSTLTLYLALTGGADWEQLAAPIREADGIFYMVFMFYIAFAGFAVLNVVTGMVVDNAMKVSAKDESSVASELQDLPEVVKFRELLIEETDNADSAASLITFERFTEMLDTEEGREFMKALEMDLEACMHVFKTVDSERLHMLDPVELINGCLHGGSQTDIELSNLVLECKRTMHQQNVFMDYVQARLDEVLNSAGVTLSVVPSIHELLRKGHHHITQMSRQVTPETASENFGFRGSADDHKQQGGVVRRVSGRLENF